MVCSRLNFTLSILLVLSTSPTNANSCAHLKGKANEDCKLRNAGRHLHYDLPNCGKLLGHHWMTCGRDSSVGIATRYVLGGPGSNPGRGGGIFRTCPDRLWGPHSFLYNGYRFFSGVKRPGRRSWPPTPSSAEVKERVEIYFYSPLRLLGLFCYLYHWMTW